MGELVAKGGYLGGGTIVSIRSLALDAARRRFEETTSDTSGNRKRKTKAKPPQQQPKAEVPPEVQAKRDAVRAKPAVRIPKAMLAHGAFLKAQVKAGILLPTGKPNPKHPANRKDAKK